MGPAGRSQGGDVKGTLGPSRVTFLLGLIRISTMIYGVLCPATASASSSVWCPGALVPWALRPPQLPPLSGSVASVGYAGSPT